MKKMIVLSWLMSLFWAQGAWSFSLYEELPPLPEDCFEEEVYCNKWEILKRRNPRNPHGRRVTRVSFFAQLDSFEFESAQAIIDRFQNFSRWIEYTEYTDDINITLSVGGPPINENGLIKYPHESYYSMKGPAIIGGKVNVKEKAFYWEVKPAKGALTTWRISHDENYDLEGVKHKSGVISLSYDEDEEVYIAYIVLDVIPGINILPKVGAPYISNSLVALFKGMFNLY